MSNYAALVDVLSIAGSRLSDGSANASGTVWFFQPGTNTQVNVYSDAAATTVITQPVTLTSGGLLNRSNFPAGIYVTQPVRVFVQDVNLNTVVDTVYVPATAGDVGVNNAGFTDSTLDAVLTKAFTSFGGQDWQYLIATGQTPLAINAAITALSVNVKAFGAKGDGVAIDTTPIQNAINYVKAAGGGIVFFPPGTFLIDQALTLSSATGVSFVGAGLLATTIKSSHATANLFTLTSCTSVLFRGFNTKNTGTSTGAAFSLTSVSPVVFTDIGVNGTDSGTYRYGMQCTNCGVPTFNVCRVTAVGGDAAARAVFLSGGGAVFIGGFYNGGAGNNWELTGTFSLLASVGVFHSSSSVLFASGLTPLAGYRYAFVGGGGLSLTVSTTTLPYIEHLASGISGSATSSAVGNTQTPVLYNGREVTLTAASGGAGTVTVAVPLILPGTAADDLNLYWDFVFKNLSGGAVTWSMNAVYVMVGGAAPAATDGHTISVRFRWDRTTSKLRECSRADTTT